MKRIILFLLATLLLLSVPVSAATNKAARIKASFFAIPETKKEVTKEELDKNTFIFETGLKTLTKLTKSSTVSFKMWIPGYLFKKAGDDISISPYLIAVDTKTNKAVYWMNSEYNFCIFYNGTNNMILDVWDNFTGKKIDAKKYASMKKKGSYYILTIKDLPVVRSVYSVSDKKIIPVSKLDLKNKYKLVSQIQTIFTMEYKGSANIFLDNLTVQTTAKQNISYNSTTTYGYLEGFNAYDAATKGKLLPVKLIAQPF